MRSIFLFAILLFTAVAVLPQTDASIKQKFKSKDYTVTWGAIPRYPSDAELVIGYGSGHGGTLGWLRFRPSTDEVEVLLIEFDEGWRPYKSKWSPDVAPVATKKGQMSQPDYAALLHKIAVVSSARLKPVSRNEVTMTSGDFWVATNVTTGSRKLLDLNWAGYSSSMDEVEYAKPKIAVDLARAAVAKLELREGPLAPEERAWTSNKFINDWKALSDREFYWWVAENMLVMAGVIGDRSVVPTLLEVIKRDISGGPRDRMIYYAINAITRITGKDVRPDPVEEMDLESTRRKVLEMLANR